MAINFPVNGDRDSGENFSLWSGRLNVSGYVHTGMEIQKNGDGTFDIGQGHCFVIRNNLDKVVGINDGEHTNISYTDGVVNHVYIVPRYQGDNKSDIQVNNPDSTPNAPNLKIATIDDTNGNAEVDRPNERPNLFGDDAFINRGRVEQWLRLNDDVPLRFGDDSEYTLTHHPASNDLLLDGPAGDHMIFKNSGDTELPNGGLDVAGDATANESQLIQDNGDVSMKNKLQFNSDDILQLSRQQAGITQLANQSINELSDGDSVGYDFTLANDQTVRVTATTDGNNNITNLEYEFYGSDGNINARLDDNGNMAIAGVLDENEVL